MPVFTSDLHHSHRRIVEFTDRGKQCESQENHDEWLISLLNDQIPNGETVYILGDYSFNHKYEEVAEFTRKIKGNKIIIKGNHDRSDTLNRLVNDNLIQAWYSYKEIRVGKQAIILFHFPIMSWHKQGYGSWHLHGHCHGNLITPRGKMLDVGLDNSYNLYGEHKLFHYDEIESFMKEQDIYIADHHKDRSMD